MFFFIKLHVPDTYISFGQFLVVGLAATTARSDAHGPPQQARDDRTETASLHQPIDGTLPGVAQAGGARFTRRAGGQATLRRGAPGSLRRGHLGSFSAARLTKQPHTFEHLSKASSRDSRTTPSDVTARNW